ncbi:MAG: hypothetical protein GY854_27660 [Deltaproteobacteria bacterium]|nr:hypothetical protein [Deltaproteobacteria bacterium]
MPLAFESLSHGTVAFGFFNIDSDMLLLEHYFFFASDFATNMKHAAEREESTLVEASWDVNHIADRADIGDLMGAIHGVRHTGFIGDTYKKFPFPSSPLDFKQKPEGFKNRTIFEEMIDGYASRKKIPFVADPAEERVKIGEYIFLRNVFHELVNYVWIGGYPRWKDEVRPNYVLAMKEDVEKSRHWLFEDIRIRDYE